MPVHIEGGVDAEKDDMPDMLIPVNWEEMKKFFRKETSRLTEKKLQIQKPTRLLLHRSPKDKQSKT